MTRDALSRKDGEVAAAAAAGGHGEEKGVGEEGVGGKQGGEAVKGEG